MQNRNIGRAIGIFFLVPFLAYGVGNGLIESVWAKPELASAKNTLILGGLLLLLNSMSVIMIAVLSFPILWERHKTIAIGYSVVRISEAIILWVGVLLLLAYLGLPAHNEAIAQVLRKGNFFAFQTAMLVLGVGSIFFCYALARFGLVPRWLGFWGIGGYGLLAIGSGLECVGYPVSLMFSIVGGLFEITFSFWLIFKGFATKP